MDSWRKAVHQGHLTKTWHLGLQLLIINVAPMQMYKCLSSMYEAAIKACCSHNQPAHHLINRLIQSSLL